MGKNRDLGDEKLTKKMIILVQLALFLRSSDMSKIFRKEIRITDTKIVLSFDIKKEQRGNIEIKEVEISCFQENENLF
jgi:hypothetical protein